MATGEQVSIYALSTVARIKDRLQITVSDFDMVLTRMLNSVTDFIERECGKSGMESYPNDGHFLQKTYTNEVYSVRGASQIYLPLKNAPVTYLLVMGNLTQGSASVTVAPYTGIVAGMPLFNIQGLFPQGTTVATVGVNGALTMSNPASVTQTAAQFEISGLISFQWRAGTPSNPNWTAFIQDQFELVEQGHSGIVRVYGVMPRIYNNMLRATYVAGFPYSWQNAGNNNGTHQVPSDLTDTCENVVARIFKRRQLAGQASENLQGATLSWRNDFDLQDKMVINHYRRVVVTA